MASSASITAGSSAAGSLWARLPADGAAVANLWMGDVTDGLSQQRPAARHVRIGLDHCLAGQGTDTERAVAHPDAAERLDAVDIDQNRGPRQAES